MIEAMRAFANGRGTARYRARLISPTPPDATPKPAP
jgi:hypothetical protein